MVPEDLYGRATPKPGLIHCSGKRLLFQGPTVTCNFSLVWSLVR